jgi:hypothetical protein
LEVKNVARSWILSLIFIFTILFSFVSCTNSAPTSPSASQANSSVSAENTKAPAELPVLPDEMAKKYGGAENQSIQKESQSVSTTKLVTLRYDNLNGEISDFSFNQIAISHPYIYFPAQSPFTVTKGDNVKSPIIMLPRKAGMVTIAKTQSGDYTYNPVGTFTSKNKIDDMLLLDKPGWGLATQFQSGNDSLIINNIRINGVAYYNRGSLDVYDQKYVRVRILNSDSETIWSQDYPWSYFRNLDTTENADGPKAAWKDIPVENVTVKGDFTVDVLAINLAYNKEANAFEYFAINYEGIPNCGDTKTNSFISENGRRPDPWVQLYDQYSTPVCFNLAIRVDGFQ